jgi:hypothetical protein
MKEAFQKPSRLKPSRKEFLIKAFEGECDVAPASRRLSREPALSVPKGASCTRYANREGLLNVFAAKATY